MNIAPSKLQTESEAATQVVSRLVLTATDNIFVQNMHKSKVHHATNRTSM
jgi:hypothetical protein